MKLSTLRNLLVFAAAFTVLGVSDSARAAETRLTLMVFQGVQDLPLFAAQAKGYFAKKDLVVDIKIAPNSEELRSGLAAGRYQIVHTAVDNAVAMAEVAKVDIAVIIGGDNSFNHLFVQPEIKSLADLRGKAVLVDAPNTAYAFQLYEILRQNGLNKGDYEVKPTGATVQRLDAMTKDKSAAAAMLNPPFSIRAKIAGLRDMTSAAKALGAYQGTAGFVLRAWGKENADTVRKYLQAYVEGVRWSLDPKNKAEAIAMLVDRLKIAEDVAAQSYAVATDPKEGLAKDGQLDLVGFANVLKLRARFQGGTPTSPEKYVDLSYYQKALKGL